MAVCTQCGSKMGQTQIVCRQCGYDFPEPERSLTSRLKDWAWKCVALGLLAILLCRWWPGTFAPHASFLKQVPPDFSTTGQWLNSQEPLTLAELQGKVVWLEFSFLR